MRIAEQNISRDHDPYVIAEIGVNHDGQAARAMELALACADAGASAVKFQYFTANNLLSQDARLAKYQEAAGALDPLTMLRALELSLDELAPIVDALHNHGTHAIVTIFSVEHVHAARALPWDAFKVASPDIINKPLLDALLESELPLILSTGAAEEHEVRQAINWMNDHPFALMQCVSSYPTSDEDAAIGGLTAMQKWCPQAIGYSDHTTGLDTGAIAVAAGACMLEKHITQDKNAQGPDHRASLHPDELHEYIARAQRAHRMVGPIQKSFSSCESDVRNVSRQSLTTTHALDAGHIITREDLTIKRPGSGIEPKHLDDIIGRAITRPIAANELLHEQDLQESSTS